MNTKTQRRKVYKVIVKVIVSVSVIRISPEIRNRGLVAHHFQMMHLHAAGLFHIDTIDITLDKALTLARTLVIDATGIVGQFL